MIALAISTMSIFFSKCTLIFLNILWQFIPDCLILHFVDLLVQYHMDTVSWRTIIKFPSQAPWLVISLYRHPMSSTAPHPSRKNSRYGFILVFILFSSFPFYKQQINIIFYGPISIYNICRAQWMVVRPYKGRLSPDARWKTKVRLLMISLQHMQLALSRLLLTLLMHSLLIMAQVFVKMC